MDGPGVYAGAATDGGGHGGPDPSWPDGARLGSWFAICSPNVLPLVVVQASLDVGYAILFTSSLSFLGLGAQPPSPEWGAMMTDARRFLQDFWWYPTFPGLALALTVLGFNLLGDGLRDWLDPRLRGTVKVE